MHNGKKTVGVTLSIMEHLYQECIMINGDNLCSIVITNLFPVDSGDIVVHTTVDFVEMPKVVAAGRESLVDVHYQFSY
jgi:hypothetical protein